MILYSFEHPTLYSDWLTRSRLRVVVPATGEQITVAEAADHCEIDPLGSPPTYEKEAWLEAAITAAREYCEGLTGLALVPQTFELVTNGFPMASFPVPWSPWSYWSGWDNGIPLETGPVIAVQTVTYPDGDGVTQTLYGVDFLLDDLTTPGILHLQYGGTWPTARGIPNAVRIRFDAGYALPGDSPSEPSLPKAIRQAMLLMIGYLYDNREAAQSASAGGSLLHELPIGVEALLERYRVRTGMA